MKKNILKRLLAGTMALSLMLVAGCSAEEETTTTTTTESGEVVATEEPMGVAVLVCGTLGDKSFNDLANEGLQQAIEELNIEGKLIEANYDTTRYETNLIEAAENDNYDLIICNSYDMKEILENTAPLFPDKQFVLYDADADFENCDIPNVYSMTYKQNEASYLAGALAAEMTSYTEDGRINDDARIGFIAGAENTIINDFLFGFIEGAQYANPDIEMYISYVGDFQDLAKGKEMGLAQYLQGADMIFQVAERAGMGVIAAATEENRYVIGVDCDQYEIFMDTDESQAQSIITSVVKNVNGTVYDCIKRALEGTLPYGTHETQGIEQGAVGIAKNAYYEEVVPQEIRDSIEEIEAKILSGEIVVGTSLGKTTEEINVIRDSVAAK